MININIKFKDLVWYNIFVLLIWHIGAIYTLIYIFPLSTFGEISILWLFFWFISGLGNISIYYYYYYTLFNI